MDTVPVATGSPIEDHTEGDDPPQSSQVIPVRVWLSALLLGLAVVAVAVLLMWWAGLFDLDARTEDAGGRALAASLGLVGAILSSVIALTGALINYSIKSAAIAQQEADRESAEVRAVEAAKRRDIEIALGAVGLLSDNGVEAPPAQTNGAVIALVRLDQVRLAVSLLHDLWPRGLVSVPVASRVVEAALAGDDERTAREATRILLRNITSIGGMQQVDYWPLAEPRWNATLPDGIKYNLALCVTEWFMDELNQSVRQTKHAFVTIIEILEAERAEAMSRASTAVQPEPTELARSLAELVAPVVSMKSNPFDAEVFVIDDHEVSWDEVVDLVTTTCSGNVEQFDVISERAIEAKGLADRSSPDRLAGAAR